MKLKVKLTFVNGKTMDIQDEAQDFRSFANRFCATTWMVYGNAAINTNTICAIEEV